MILRFSFCVVKGNLNIVLRSVPFRARCKALTLRRSKASPAGTPAASENVGWVSLSSKRASLLGKFPIPEPDRNTQDKNRAGDRPDGNPTPVSEGGNCRGIATSPYLRCAAGTTPPLQELTLGICPSHEPNKN
jgi:hypothetical protein